MLFINFCSQSSLKSATDCCQTERQIQHDAWGSARILHVSQKNSSIRTVLKCLKRNKDHLITLQIRMEWRYHVWGATHEAIWKPSEAQNSFWIKSRTGKDMGQFSADPINKAVQSFTDCLSTVMDNILSIYSLLKKVFALTEFALSWIVETIFTVWRYA